MDARWPRTWRSALRSVPRGHRHIRNGEETDAESCGVLPLHSHLTASRAFRESFLRTAEDAMKLRFALIFLVLSMTLPVNARMLRVLGVHDERTLVVDTGTPTRIELGGITITDRQGAQEFLQWTLTTAWVTGEKRPDGYLVWRSPDGLFVNRELVTRGYARPASIELEPSRNFSVTYIGQLHPEASQRRLPTTVTAPAGSGSGTSRPPRAARRPRSRPVPQKPPGRED